MALRIEDYALLSDTQTAALVGTDGSIDWLCLPSFSSGACFAGLLGDDAHGHWRIAPTEPVTAVRRRYREGSLVLETEFETASGTVRLIDCMPPRGMLPDVVRIVEGVSGRVDLHVSLVIRFDYGSIVPWVRRDHGAIVAIAGPDALILRTTVPMRGRKLTTVGDVSVEAGERVPFVLTWFPSHEPPPKPVHAEDALRDTEEFWTEWSGRSQVEGPWRREVLDSLVVLKGLTDAPTGGIVAAATTSLPEDLGGVRNWDYRFCWLRDATFTLEALLTAGYREEAAAWRDWLLRAVAGDPADLRIMYGITGERRLTELELPWLPGYEGSAPVRIGNAASTQLQLDVYGEVIDALAQARRAGLDHDHASWRLQHALMSFLESSWREPDESLWEIRGPRRQFTYSKVMAWVAFDRAVRTVEEDGLDGPADRWRAVRDEIHATVCREGYDAELGAFVQSFGAKHLDASLLRLAQVGFLAPDDPRFVGTVEAVKRHLVRDGLVLRYDTDHGVDGVAGDEGAFLACSFWLVDALALIGRIDEATELFERLLALRNDVGLLSEEYDTRRGRMVGNVPQAFSHVGLIHSATTLAAALAERADGAA